MSFLHPPVAARAPSTRAIPTIIPVPTAQASACGQEVSGAAGFFGGRSWLSDFQLVRAAARVITAATIAEPALASIHRCSSDRDCIGSP